jgi:hypothetical protein
LVITTPYGALSKSMVVVAVVVAVVVVANVGV